MFCAKCGTVNDDNFYRCAKCGEIREDALGPVIPVKIHNYLVQAILVTLCCCLPFGIVSIIYAAQTNSLLKAGNVQAALETSAKAKTWCRTGFWVGFGIMAIMALLRLLVPPPHPNY